MTRFDQDDLFDRMAARGALSAPLMSRLADGVMAFHRDAEPRIGADGADIMRRVVDGNRRGIARRTGDVFDTDIAERFFTLLDAALQDCAPLLGVRARRGMVRVCHGDLHLRNICLLDGAPTLFDAIEFNEALSVIDVLYDLAFLVMDLVHRDLGDLANLVLNRYLQRSEDYGGLAALPLFFSCRAAVRAHIGAAAADAQTDPAEADRLYDEARRYLDLGLGFLERSGPRLLAVGGLSGSGKTALARALAPTLGAPPGAVHLQSDVIRKLMFSRVPEARLDAEAYAEPVSRTVHDRLHQRAAAALAAGCSVVCDAT
jgi:aminoglycoside phosphotransferase family enzyme